MMAKSCPRELAAATLIRGLAELPAKVRAALSFSLNKQIPIASQVKLKLQGVFLNAFNHVAWYGDYLPVQSSYFGTTAIASGPRNIEVRANIEF